MKRSRHDFRRKDAKTQKRKDANTVLVTAPIAKILLCYWTAITLASSKVQRMDHRSNTNAFFVNQYDRGCTSTKDNKWFNKYKNNYSNDDQAGQ